MIDPTINPFVSKKQSAACFAGAMPGVDCKEWAAKTDYSSLPKKNGKGKTRNSKKQTKVVWLDLSDVKTPAGYTTDSAIKDPLAVAPILVTQKSPTTNKHHILDGHKRFIGMRLGGVTKLRAIVSNRAAPTIHLSPVAPIPVSVAPAAQNGQSDPASSRSNGGTSAVPYLAANAGKKSVNPLRFDPTRTLGLRRHFTDQLGKQFDLLKQRIQKYLVDDNALGLVENHTNLQMKTVGLDFDGTVTQDRTKWDDLENVKPRGGVADAVRKLQAEGLKVIIYTGNPHHDEIRQWLTEHDIPFDGIKAKEPMGAYIDDRGVEAGDGHDWDDVVHKAIELTENEAIQPIHSWGDAERLAPAIQNKFEYLLLQLGLPVVKMKDAGMGEPEALLFGYSGCVVVIADHKSQQRSKEKVEKDYDGDWTQLKDLIRASIICDTLSEMRYWSDRFKGIVEDDGGSMVGMKDRFTNPLPNGYRDLHCNYSLSVHSPLLGVEDEKQFIVEVQYHLKPTWLAKARTEVGYDAGRGWGDPLTRIDKSTRKLYDQAMEEVNNRYSAFLTTNGAVGYFPAEGKFLKPDPVEQENGSDCGAAAVKCLFEYQGAESRGLEDWKELLGTDHDGTPPGSIIVQAKEEGLPEEHGPMTVDDLKRYIGEGWGVLCPIQSYAPKEDQKRNKAGHWVVVVSVGAGYVFVMDPYVHKVLDGKGSVAAPGIVMIEEDKWNAVWHDKDPDGNEYDHWGIAIGPSRPEGPSVGPKTLSLNEFNPDQARDEQGRFGSGGGGSVGASHPLLQKLKSYAPKLKSAITAGVKKVIEGLDEDSLGGGSMILGGALSRNPRMIAAGASLVFSSVFKCVHQEVFENALSGASVPGAAALAKVGSGIAGKGEQLVRKGLRWAGKKALGTNALDKRPRKLTQFDHNILDMATMEAQKALKEIGVKTMPKSGRDLRDNVQRTLLSHKPDLTANLEGPHQYCSTQFDIPEPVRSNILRLSALIPNDELTEEGRETMPHVTVLYGLDFQDEDGGLEAIRKLLKGVEPVKLTLGPTNFFSNDDADVLYVEVSSPDLIRLNGILSALPTGKTKSADYTPHVTLAYLRPGLGPLYAGDDSLEGIELTLDQLLFSGREGNKTAIPLRESVKNQLQRVLNDGGQSYFATCERDKGGHCLPESSDDAGGGDGEGKSKETARGNIRQKVKEETDKIQFTDEVLQGEDPVDIRDTDEIEDRMTSMEREEMSQTLEDWKENNVDQMMDDFEPEVDDDNTRAKDNGYHQSDCVDKINDLIDEHVEDEDERDRLKSEVDDVYQRSGDHGADFIRQVQRGVDDIPDDLDRAIDNLHDEAREATEKAEQEQLDEQESEYRDDLERNYDDSDDRREYLRDFFREHEDEERYSGKEEVPMGVWGKDKDGDGMYGFETSSGQKYEVRAVDEGTYYGVPNVRQIMFSDESGSFKVTGAGGAHEVFGKVVPAVVAYAQHEDPENLMFSAAEPSRRRLYDRLVKTVAEFVPAYSAITVEREGGEGPRYYFLTKRGNRQSIEDAMEKQAEGHGWKIKKSVIVNANTRNVIDPEWWSLRGWSLEYLLNEFNPSQPRDERGRFGSGGSSAVTPIAERVTRLAQKTVSAYQRRMDQLKQDVEVGKVPPHVEDLAKGAKDFLVKTVGGIRERLEGRYGKTAAVTIMASGQLLSWGSMAAGMATTGVPLWLPGSSIWGVIPGAAVAEAFLQAHKVYKKLTGVRNQLEQVLNATTGRKESHIAYAMPNAQQEAIGIQQEVMEAYRKWLEEHKTKVMATENSNPEGYNQYTWHKEPGNRRPVKMVKIEDVTGDHDAGYNKTKSDEWAGLLAGAIQKSKKVQALTADETEDGKFKIIDGKHRLQALKSLGATHVGIQVTKSSRDVRNAAVDPSALQAFQQWLNQQMSDLLLSHTQEQLWAIYARRGYEKGAGRAFDDASAMKRAQPTPGTVAPDDMSAWYQGGRDQFLRDSFAQPVSVDRVKVLAGRSFDEMKNVTHDMGTRMSRSLTDSLVQGKGAREAARDLEDVTDFSRKRAETVARTEIVRAHAEGQLDTMERLGVKAVGVQVEWMTADDDRVCPQCNDLNGKVLSIDKARGMLPRHPNCRCAWRPALPDWAMEPTKNALGWDSAKESLPRGWFIGVLPVLNAVSVTALKAADFVKLPKDVSGTNCGNCEYQKGGICQHPKLKGLEVSAQECCAYWDNPGAKRDWKDKATTNSNPEGHNQYTDGPHTKTRQQAKMSYAAHSKAVEDALMRGDQVPDKVLAQYPGMKEMVEAKKREQKAPQPLPTTPAVSSPVKPTSLGLSDDAAADKVRASFGSLESQHNGIVSIHAIQQHSGMPLADVHRGVQHLRRKGELTGTAYEERKPRPEVVAAGIKEGENNIISHVSRRTS